MAFDFFLSYRRADRPLAKALVEALERRGVSIWWDEKIEAGVDWRDAIVENLIESHVLIILFSEECNSSKQLKKELALADDMNKDVVPVLIEDTKPKGHFLYELAARNWVQIHPHPERKIDELADKLLAMTGKAPVQSTPEAPIDQSAATEVVKTVQKTVSTAPKASKPKTAKAKKTYRNYMPLKWIDLPVIIGAPASIFFTVAEADLDSDGIIGSLFYGVCIIAIFGALAFPIRYFMRGLRAGRAFWNYVASAITFYIIAFGLLVLYSVLEGRWASDMTEIMIFAGIGTAVSCVVAFIIYGIMHFFRSMNAFKQHVEEI